MPTTSPSTIQHSSFTPSMPASWTIWVTLHSSAAIASATRGGFTLLLGAIFRPANVNSFTPWATGAEVAFIARASLALTSEQVNSPVA